MNREEFYPKDLLAAVQAELEATIDDMLSDPFNYGLPQLLDRDGGVEGLDEQDPEWIKARIAHNWGHIDR